MANEKTDQPKHSHRDPLSGEPGAHPVGVGVGTAVGGGVLGAGLGAAGSTAVAGAALGTSAGPVGAVVGAVAGGIVGGLIGKNLAEKVDPTAEEAYWREHYQTRPYVDTGAPYDEYGAAYRYGWETRGQHVGQKFEEVEPELRSDWEEGHDKSKMPWDKAKHAARDAWERLDRSDVNSPKPQTTNANPQATNPPPNNPTCRT
jgi:hypothetical protein